MFLWGDSHRTSMWGTCPDPFASHLRYPEIWTYPGILSAVNNLFNHTSYTLYLYTITLDSVGCFDKALQRYFISRKKPKYLS